MNRFLMLAVVTLLSAAGCSAEPTGDFETGSVAQAFVGTLRLAPVGVGPGTFGTWSRTCASSGGTVATRVNCGVGVGDYGTTKDQDILSYIAYPTTAGSYTQVVFRPTAADCASFTTVDNVGMDIRYSTINTGLAQLNLNYIGTDALGFSFDSPVGWVPDHQEWVNRNAGWSANPAHPGTPWQKSEICGSLGFSIGVKQVNATPTIGAFEIESMRLDVLVH